jgi:hypothetical protein
VADLAAARIRRREILGGLIHEYERAACRTTGWPRKLHSEAMDTVLAPYRPPDADDVSVAAVTDLAAVAAADMTRKVLSGLIHEYERVA